MSGARHSVMCEGVSCGSCRRFAKSLSVYQWGQMSGLAVEEQTQPHLINNIIVLLRTAIKTHPPSVLFSLSFYFRLWQCAVLWYGWAGVTLPPSSETKHKSRARGLRQTALQCVTRPKNPGMHTFSGDTAHANTHTIMEYMQIESLTNH